MAVTNEPLIESLVREARRNPLADDTAAERAASLDGSPVILHDRDVGAVTVARGDTRLQAIRK